MKSPTLSAPKNRIFGHRDFFLRGATREELKSFRGVGRTGLNYPPKYLASAWPQIVALIIATLKIKKLVAEIVFNIRHPLPSVLLLGGAQFSPYLDRRFRAVKLPDRKLIEGVARQLGAVGAWSFEAAKVARASALLLGARSIVVVSRKSAASASEEIAKLLEDRHGIVARIACVALSRQLARKVAGFVRVVDQWPESVTPDVASQHGPNSIVSRPANLGDEEVSVADLERFWERADLFRASPSGHELTELGCVLLQDRLTEKILKVDVEGSSRPRPPIVQVVDNSQAFLGGRFSFGLGDVLLGSALVHEEAMRALRLPTIDWTAFSARGSLLTRSPLLTRYEPANSATVSYQINGNVPVDFATSTRVFTNRRPSGRWTPARSDFLFRNGVWPSSSVSSGIEDWLASEGLTKQVFSSVHVRFGDPGDRKEVITSAIYEGFEEFVGQSERYVVIADFPELLESYFSVPNLHFRMTRPRHSGMPVDKESFNEVLQDFFIVAQGQHLYQLSRYHWGSGFSSIAADLFGVPRALIVRGGQRGSIRSPLNVENYLEESSGPRIRPRVC